jgi:branched-chain amino acid transport system ATP-binding protein
MQMQVVETSETAASGKHRVMLEIEGVTSHYGRVQALHGIHIQVNEGQLVALVGANGAGKSTLLRAISGVQPISTGAIRFDGKNITALRAHARVSAGICQVPEGRQVFAPMSVEDNIHLGAYCRRKSAVEYETEKMYSLFPILKEKRRQLAGNLSGGQQQMLAMARALMGQPKLLLLDEPSMGLAPLLVQEIFRVVADLRGRGITILLVEQNAHAALSIADSGYVMETGAISMSGSGKDLLHDDRIRSAYLGM